MTGAIEEAQVAVETGCATADLDYELLGGQWLLRYTTASDVVGPACSVHLTAPNVVGPAVDPAVAGERARSFRS